MHRMIVGDNHHVGATNNMVKPCIAQALAGRFPRSDNCIDQFASQRLDQREAEAAPSIGGRRLALEGQSEHRDDRPLRHHGFQVRFDCFHHVIDDR